MSRGALTHIQRRIRTGEAGAGTGEGLAEIAGGQKLVEIVMAVDPALGGCQPVNAGHAPGRVAGVGVIHQRGHPIGGDRPDVRQPAPLRRIGEACDHAVGIGDLLRLAVRLIVDRRHQARHGVEHPGGVVAPRVERRADRKRVRLIGQRRHLIAFVAQRCRDMAGVPDQRVVAGDPAGGVIVAGAGDRAVHRGRQLADIEEAGPHINVSTLADTAVLAIAKNTIARFLYWIPPNLSKPPIKKQLSNFLS